MASILIHFVVSEKIKNELNLTDKFVIGSIFPDMIKMTVSNKAKSHYISEFITYTNENIFLPNLDKFLKENKDKINDDFVLGYYAHLIQDMIWEKEYINPKIKYVDNKNVLYKQENKVYNVSKYVSDLFCDYNKIDEYLIKKYSLDIGKIKTYLKKELIGHNCEEIIDKYILNRGNIDYSASNLVSIEQLEEYIDKSIKECKKEIEKLKNN